MCDSASSDASCPTRRRRTIAAMAIGLLMLTIATRAAAADQMYFAATDNITDVLVQRINAETVRVDISCWYLTEHSISIALINKFNAGVPVRLIGDRGSIFEIDKLTKNEFYWLANQGLPIRLRFNPTWYPEIDHWKTSIFVGQGLASFGSANYTPFELAPASSTNYKDETVLVTDDSSIVNAVKTKFDRIWNDTTAEPESLVPSAPYFKDWNDACTNEPTGCDFFTVYPNPAPMVINHARLEPDNPLPLDLIWGQGPDFNNRLVQEINNETTSLQFVIYRLTVDNITQALLDKYKAGVPIQLIIEPNEYLNRKWPEFWLTHANLDKLWAAGIPMKQRLHDGLTHMKTLVTSTYATNASSNYAAAWQRDIDYFIAAAAKPTIYQALKDRVTAMWNNTSAFTTFQPQPPDAPALASPASDATGVATTTSLVWQLTPFAVSYDIYLGTTQSNTTLVGNVPAQMVNNPPATYSWTPTTPLQPGTRYVWKVVSRTNATPVNPSLVGSSSFWAFTTAGAAGPPNPPANPSPSDTTAGVGLSPTLTWSIGTLGTTYNVAFGSVNPPPSAASGLSSSSYAPGTLNSNTTYYWQVTAVSSTGTASGPVWSFTTGTQPVEIVMYASDVQAQDVHGMWSLVGDSTSPNGIKLATPYTGWSTANALSSPADYFDVSFNANAGTPYTIWLRLRSIDNAKHSDSVWVQFSDAWAGGSQVYPINSTSGLLVKLASDSTATSDNAWGWVDGAYWLTQPATVTFPATGTHTIRVQVRFSGVEVDQIVLSPTTYFNASASCPNTCGSAPGPITNDHTIVPKPSQGQGPGAPGTPNPANGATGVSINPTLTWSASGATSYDVSFGTANPPPLVISGGASASYTPPALTNNATYFWQIVARNSAGSTTGAVWSFTTSATPPATPNTPAPAAGATGVATNLTLTWASAGATTYDVLFGPTEPPSQVASGLTTASYTPAGLTAGTTYFWQIVAHNSGGANQGPEWTCTTAAATQPPSAPASPSPTSAATGVATNPTLTWTATGATSYDVTFGTTNPPPSVASGQAAASYTPPALAGGTTYSWQIVAHNNGGTTSGPLWSFTTTGSAPAPPSSPSPADGATGVATNVTLTCTSSGATSYDVKFGATNPPASVSSAQANCTYAASGLATSTAYFWQIVSHNAGGNATGPVWSFTTVPPAPGAPATPSPADAATNVSVTPTLSWSATGATSYDVRFGATNPPSTVASGQASASYAPGMLAYTTTYFWQAVAKNSGGATSGPVWSFTTGAAPPPPPSMPGSPTPANAATNVSTTPTLSWSSTGATTFDVKFGMANPPPTISTAQAAASYTPAALANSTTYYWQILANNASGTTAGPVWSFTTAAAPNIVIYASDVPTAAIHGMWSVASDTTAANGTKLITPDNGWASTNNALAAPTDYFEVTFSAPANTPYGIWLRLQALNNSKYNDSVWVQFSDAQANGALVYPLNSTSALDVNLATDAGASSLNGWGWQNGAYWLTQATTVTFASSGTHTMRIQVREDGVQLDQIVLSPSTYLGVAPGSVSHDSTIVPRP